MEKPVIRRGKILDQARAEELKLNLPDVSTLPEPEAGGKPELLPGVPLPQK